MLLEDMKKMVSELSPDELETIVRFANQEKIEREEKKEAKYMAAIRKALDDYFQNVGSLAITFHDEEEVEHEMEYDTISEILTGFHYLEF